MQVLCSLETKLTQSNTLFWTPVSHYDKSVASAGQKKPFFPSRLPSPSIPEHIHILTLPRRSHRHRMNRTGPSLHTTTTQHKDIWQQAHRFSVHAPSIYLLNKEFLQRSQLQVLNLQLKATNVYVHLLTSLIWHVLLFSLAVFASYQIWQIKFFSWGNIRRYNLCTVLPCRLAITVLQILCNQTTRINERNVFSPLPAASAVAAAAVADAADTRATVAEAAATTVAAADLVVPVKRKKRIQLKTWQSSNQRYNHSNFVYLQTQVTPFVFIQKYNVQSLQYSTLSDSVLIFFIQT